MTNENSQNILIRESRIQYFEEALELLRAYYHICNYKGKVTCAALIDGIEDILSGHTQTTDAYASDEFELHERINAFLVKDLEKHITVDY